jgi:hypothetical protein
VWGAGYEGDVDVLRVFVSQLRRKIEEDPRRPGIIVTDPASDIGGCSVRPSRPTRNSARSPALFRK